MTCIISGIHTIPSEPKDVYVDAVNEKSIKVFWQPPDQLANKVNNYVINVTQLHTFDPDTLADLSHAELSISVDRVHTSVLVNNLQPFTMYEVSVMATNKFGSSLPSFRVRTLTLDSSLKGRGSGVGSGGQLNPVVPKLPGKNTPHFPHSEFIFRECFRRPPSARVRIKCKICGSSNNNHIKFLICILFFWLSLSVPCNPASQCARRSAVNIYSFFSLARLFRWYSRKNIFIEIFYTSWRLMRTT